MMAYFYKLLNWVTFIFFCTASRREIDWLEVIPHIENLENFYRQIRAQNQKLYNGKERTTHLYAKNSLCWNLLASGFFDMPDVELEPVDMNMIWVYYELKLMYPRIMEKLYEELPPLEASPKTTKYRYSNPTVVINVNLEKESVPEYAFICLGRTRGSKSRLIQYYVSEEYLVGDGSFSHHVGRFMFTITDDEQIKVYLFAEEPARILTSSQHNIEHLYLQARENKEPAKTPDTDPLCNLSVKEKIQICTSVLSSPHFDDEIDYVPDIDDAPTECNKWKVALSTEESTQYEEWMMQCVAVSTVTDSSVIFYLSRAYSPYKVFIFRPKSNTNGKKTYVKSLVSLNLAEKVADVKNLPEPNVTEEMMSVENLCVNVRNVKG